MSPQDRPTKPERRRYDTGSSTTARLLREAREDAERASVRAMNVYAVINGRKIRGEME